MKNWMALLLCLVFYSLLTVSAQEEPIDKEMVQKIRDEGLQHSQVAMIAHYLTDVAGSRLTNSPGHHRAIDWAVATMKGWHLANAAKEPWGEFGKGWEIKKCYVALTAPYYHPIIAYPFGWSAGLASPLSATVVAVSMSDSGHIKSMTGELKGKIVMVTDTFSAIRPASSTASTRLNDSDLVKMNDQFWVTKEETVSMIDFIHATNNFYSLLQKKGAAILITRDYGGRDGSIYADAMEHYEKNQPATVPKLIISTEDFFLLKRLVNTPLPVRMDIDLKTQFYTNDLNGYNVVAEIPGTDPVLKDQLVIIGGHLDSWYSGTGATDNAAGCTVMMEVMRILKTLDIKPRRTIRIVLWGAEEQGLWGSYHYVKNHFADPVTKVLKPDQAKVSAYYNLDNGTGKVRGIFLQHNEAVRPIFEKWLEPFADLGATAVKSGNTGETDHYTFDIVGIPGFEFIQDPLEYLSRTHHSNMDTYDHLSIPDLQQAATVIASFVYHTAMREQMLPRKPLTGPEPWLFDGF